MDEEELVEYIERCKTVWSYNVVIAPNLEVTRTLMAPSYEEAMLRAGAIHKGSVIKNMKQKGC